MISILIAIMLALTALIAASYYLYTLIYNQSTQIDAQHNKIFISEVKNNLLKYARPVGENEGYVLPYGENIASTYHTIPSWVSSDRKNPWGNYIIYCPLGTGNNITTTATAALNSTLSYSVQLVSDFRTVAEGSARNYVSNSRFIDIDADTVFEQSPDFDLDGNPDPIIGFLISPYRNPTNTVPTCLDINYLAADEAFVATGGTVSVIYEQEAKNLQSLLQLSEIGSPKDESKYVANITNVGSDTLNNNLIHINNISPQKVEILVPDGTHSIGNISFLNDSKIEKEIIIKGVEDDLGTGPVEKSIIDSSLASSLLQFENYKVTLDNIYFASDTRLIVRKGKLFTENDVEVSTVYLENTDWTVTGNTKAIASSLNNTTDVINGSVSSVFLKSSNLYINEANQLEVELHTSDDWGLYLFDSKITIDGNASTDNLVIEHSSISGNYGIILYQSEIMSRQGKIRINAGASQEMGLYLDTNSEYHGFYGSLSLSGYEKTGVYQRGKFESVAHDIITRDNHLSNIVFDLKDGASLILRETVTVGSTINANKPIIGIKDSGAKFIGGTGTVNVYATSKCWQGDDASTPRIFTATNVNFSAVSTIGNTSSTTLVKNDTNSYYELYKISNNSNWNCTN